MIYTVLCSGREIPLLFLLFGILGVYFGSFGWMLVLLLCAVVFGIAQTKITQKEINLLQTKGKTTFNNDKNYYNLGFIIIIGIYIGLIWFGIYGILIFIVTFCMFVLLRRYKLLDRIVREEGRHTLHK